jgi:hypothetical protein
VLQSRRIRHDSVLGLEAGFAGAVRRTDKEDAADEGREFVPGMYAGLNAVLPHDEYPVFVSAGACLFFTGREHELYVMVTGLFNFE